MYWGFGLSVLVIGDSTMCDLPNNIEALSTMLRKNESIVKEANRIIGRVRTKLKDLHDQEFSDEVYHCDKCSCDYFVEQPCSEHRIER